VARRFSIQLKRQEMNRLKRDTRASAMRAQTESPQLACREIQELLDTALQDLPEKFRATLILCYLEGKTQEEAAKQLGCPVGTVQSRLSRGRKLSAGVPEALLTREAQAAIGRLAKLRTAKL
jgi:RNA polymerase sigma factor (sigma-70 family)